MFDPVYLKSGDVLPGGKYVLIQTLGRGAMGIVFWAKDQHLHRDVALKFLSDGARKYPEVKQRFLREARALAKIQNPHVVQVYEVSADDADELFIAMEYLVGSDLGARLGAGFRPHADEGIELGLQACRALAAAHQQGIVHRDLKPSNLFLTREGVLKIVDFGVSKVLNEPRLTRTGEALGTPYYMSPEQVRCEGDIDGRTDIWSLGVILYEMLCGTRPFEGTTLGEVMSGILNDTPRTLNERGVRVPPALDELISRCLDKDRDRRFSDVHELARALKAAITAQPDQLANTLASEPSPPLRPAPAARKALPATRSKGRGTYALGGALAGGALALVAVLAMAWTRRAPSTMVHALSAAPASPSVLPPGISGPHPMAVDAPPPVAHEATTLDESMPSTAHVTPPQPSSARTPARMHTPAPAHDAAHPNGPATSALNAAPRASTAASAAAPSASSVQWLPKEPVGAAVSPYAEHPAEP